MNLSKPIRILIADDHETVRRGLNDLFHARAGFEVVGMATNAADTVSLAAELLPDIILIDVKMPAKNGEASSWKQGFEAAQRIMVEHANIKIIMITSSDEMETYRQAQMMEVHGYYTKADSGVELLKIIRHVHQGQRDLKAPPIQTLLQNTTNDLRVLSNLTPRQQEVMRLLVENMSTKQIAETLTISAGSVRNHIKDIFKRLNVNTRLDAIRLVEDESRAMPNNYS